MYKKFFEANQEVLYANMNHDDEYNLFISSEPWAQYNDKLEGPYCLIIWDDESLQVINGKSLQDVFKDLIDSYFYDEREEDKGFIPTDQQLIETIENSEVDKDSSSGITFIDLINKKVLYEPNNANVMFYEYKSEEE